MKNYILTILLSITLIGGGIAQELLQTEIVNLVGGGDVSVTGPTLGAAFNPGGFTAQETVRLYLDVSLVNPRGDDRNLAGTTEDLFLFIFEGGGSISNDPTAATQLTRQEGDLFFIDIDLTSNGLISTDVVTDGGIVRGLIRAGAFEDGQSGDFEIRFQQIDVTTNAVFTVPETFTAEDSISIFLNSDLAFAEDGTTLGQLTGQTDVFLWSGANNFTLTPEGQENFSEAFEPGRMEVISDNLFRITIDIRSYYGLSEEVVVTDITLLFKNTDGSLSARSADGNFVLSVESSEEPQIPVSIFPQNYIADDLVTITFDAKFPLEDGSTPLLASDEVFLFAGARVSEDGDGFERTPEGQDFSSPIGPGLMRSLGDRIYSISIIPREYFGLEDGEQIFDISILFRSPDGSAQTSPNFVFEADDCPQ